MFRHTADRDSTFWERTSTIPLLALELLSEVEMRARQLDLTGGGNAELVAHLIGSFYGSQHVANTDQAASACGHLDCCT